MSIPQGWHQLNDREIERDDGNQIDGVKMDEITKAQPKPVEPLNEKELATMRERAEAAYRIRDAAKREAGE